MVLVEVPVEQIEGAGSLPGLDVGAVRASLTVVAHLVDVCPSGCVWLGRHESAVSVEGHAEEIGGHHPVMGVDVHLIEPSESLLRLHTSQQEEIPKDHQSLDVMIESTLQDFAQGLMEAVEICLPIIEEGGEGTLRSKTVDLFVLRHF